MLMALVLIRTRIKDCKTKLDIAEKHGFLGKMFDIVSKMVGHVNDK